MDKDKKYPAPGSKERQKLLDEEYGKGPEPWGFDSENVARKELRRRKKRGKA